MTADFDHCHACDGELTNGAWGIPVISAALGIVFCSEDCIEAYNTMSKEHEASA